VEESKLDDLRVEQMRGKELKKQFQWIKQPERWNNFKFEFKSRNLKLYLIDSENNTKLFVITTIHNSMMSFPFSVALTTTTSTTTTTTTTRNETT
jgi:hypothetical protein